MVNVQAAFTTLQALGPQTTSRAQPSASTPAAPSPPRLPSPVPVVRVIRSRSPTDRASSSQCFPLQQQGEMQRDLRSPPRGIGSPPRPIRALSPSPDIGKWLRQSSPQRVASPPHAGPPHILMSPISGLRASMCGSTPPQVFQSPAIGPRCSSPPVMRTAVRYTSAGGNSNLQVFAPGASPNASVVVPSCLARQESQSPSLAERAAASGAAYSQKPLPVIERCRSETQGVRSDHPLFGCSKLSISTSALPGVTVSLPSGMSSRPSSEGVRQHIEGIRSNESTRLVLAKPPWRQPSRVIAPSVQPSPRATPEGTPNQKEPFRNTISMSGAPGSAVIPRLVSNLWQCEAELTKADHEEQLAEERGSPLQEQPGRPNQARGSAMRTSELGSSNLMEGQWESDADVPALSMGSMPSDCSDMLCKCSGEEGLSNRSAMQQVIQDVDSGESSQLTSGRHCPQLPAEVLDLFEDHVKAIRASLDSLGARENIAESFAQHLGQPGLKGTYGYPAGAHVRGGMLSTTLEAQQDAAALQANLTGELVAVLADLDVHVQTHVAAQQAKMTGELVSVLADLEKQATIEAKDIDRNLECEQAINEANLHQGDRKDIGKHPLPAAARTKAPQSDIRKSSVPRGSGVDAAAAKSVSKGEGVLRRSPLKTDSAKRLSASQSMSSLGKEKSPGRTKILEAPPPQVSRANGRHLPDGVPVSRSPSRGTSSPASAVASSPALREKSRRLPSESPGHHLKRAIRGGQNSDASTSPAASPQGSPAASPKARPRQQRPSSKQLSSVARSAMSSTTPPSRTAVSKRKAREKAEFQAEQWLDNMAREEEVFMENTLPYTLSSLPAGAPPALSLAKPLSLAEDDEVAVTLSYDSASAFSNWPFLAKGPLSDRRQR